MISTKTYQKRLAKANKRANLAENELHEARDALRKAYMLILDYKDVGEDILSRAHEYMEEDSHDNWIDLETAMRRLDRILA